MRVRTALAGAVALLAAAGSISPALAGPTAGPVKGSWAATASPDPTGDTPGGSAKCQPVTPTGRATKEFTIPAAGTLELNLHNSLDWSADVRDKATGDVLGDADGGAPNDVEVVSVSVKKKTTVILGACNLEGEGAVNATYQFTPKKR